MRKLITISLVVFLTASCSKSPPARPITVNKPTTGTEQPAAEPKEAPSVESPAVEAAAVERDAPLEVGDVAPDFRLQDQQGAEHSLTSLIGDGQVALVFYRSADL